MPSITAVELAKRAGIEPKKLRDALRQHSGDIDLAWHKKNDPWIAEMGSDRHNAMERILNEVLNGNDELAPDSEEPKIPLTLDVLKRSVILIVSSLLTGALLVWCITFDWFLHFVAVAIPVALAGLGWFVAHKVYKSIGNTYPSWVRLTVSIILGLAVCVAIGILTRSHKLIRFEDQQLSVDSDN